MNIITEIRILYMSLKNAPAVPLHVGKVHAAHTLLMLPKHSP
jgi:hypothetical protein